MNRFRWLTTCVLAFSFVSSSACGAGAGTTVAQLAVLRTALGEVEKTLTAGIAQTDDAARNRISQVDTTVKDGLKNLNQVIDNIEDSTTVQREEAARQAFGALLEARRLIDDTGTDLFGELNQTLAGVAATLDAVPFVKMDNIVLAVSPYKLRKDAAEHEVSVFGYFPSIKSDAAAVKVLVGGQTVPVRRSVGRVFFDLPPDVLAKETPIVDVRIQFPKSAFWRSAPTPVDTRLRLVNATPYSFVVEAMKENPAAWETVQGSGHSETANSHNPNRNVHLSAEALFNVTVNNPRYDASTAQIVGVDVTRASGDRPCPSCPEPTGRVTGWTGSGIDIALSAPNCGTHTVNKTCHSGGLFNVPYPCPYICGGGGSHFTVTVKPTFMVRVKGVPDATPIDTRTINAGWRSVSEAVLPSEWMSVIVKLRFNDNFDKGETVVVIKKGAPIATSALFDARVENNKLILATR